MGKLQDLIIQHSIISFILLTLIISLVSFTLMLVIPNAQTPESILGLPVWLIAIWSPNISALIIWACRKNIISNLQLAFSLPKFSFWSLIILIPVLVSGALIAIKLVKGVPIEWANFKVSYILPLIFINLLMGPLGEEIGWRGLLYPLVKETFGWMASAVFVGVIWALWHAPLWFIDSPQSRIPFWAFSINVVCLSILMSIVYNYSNGSLILIILFHLIFNFCLGFIDILGSHEPGEYVIKSLYIYVPFTLVLSGYMNFSLNQIAPTTSHSVTLRLNSKKPHKLTLKN